MQTVRNAEVPSSPGGRVAACDDRGAAQAAIPQTTGGSSWTLWLWVGAAFLLLAVAWGVLFTVARSAKVESVPLAPTEARP